MTKLVETRNAEIQVEEQLRIAEHISLDHLRILASDKGRFAKDRFKIYHHELQLREALDENPELDVEYARQQIRAFAQKEISYIHARELAKKHRPAIQNGHGRIITDIYTELNNQARIQHQLKQTIAQIRNP